MALHQSDFFLSILPPPMRRTTAVILTNMSKVHCASKNIPPVACYNFDPCALIFWYVLAEMLPIKYTIKRCFTMPPQITSASALPGKMGNVKIVFFSGCISALPEFNQLLLDFFYLFDSRLILTLLYYCLNLVVNAFSLGLLGAWFRRKEVESAAAVGLCCTHNAPVHCLLGFLFRKVMLKH